MSTLRIAAGKVIASQKRCLGAWPVLLQPCLELKHSESIDSCCTLVPHDPLIRSPEVATFDYGVHLPQPFRFRSPIRRRAYLSTQPGHRRNPFVYFRSGSSFLLCCFINLHRGRMS
jgi:hypothetical protein